MAKRSQRQHQQIMRAAYLQSMTRTGSTWTERNRYHELLTNATRTMGNPDLRLVDQVANAMSAVWYAAN